MAKSRSCLLGSTALMPPAPAVAQDRSSRASPGTVNQAFFIQALPTHSHEPLRQQSTMVLNVHLLGKSGFFHTLPEQLWHLHHEMDDVVTNNSGRQHVGHISLMLLSCGHCTFPKQEKIKRIAREVKALGYL